MYRKDSANFPIEDKHYTDPLGFSVVAVFCRFCFEKDLFEKNNGVITRVSE